MADPEQLAGPEQLEPVTFRQTKNQRGTKLTGGIVFVPVSIYLLVQGSRPGKDAAALVIAGVLLLLLGIVLLASRNARATIDLSWPPSGVTGRAHGYRRLGHPHSDCLVPRP
ncbi:MAG: hypothetical protein ACLPKI_25780 [Streptosporangiaceae bacterium]